MESALTTDQALALAPDDASAKAAGALASPGKWATLGSDADALWGECKGSGAKPYQAQVDLAALVTRCSCPSRKFPCKHALALLLIHVKSGVPAAARPSWVEEWLNSRRDKAAKKEQSAANIAAAQAADPQAAEASAAKREAARWKRIEAGSAELQRWICDQFRRGLAAFGEQQRGEWSAMAARMVDAQAPALSYQVLAALESMRGGLGSIDEVVERLGLLWLLHEGVGRRAQLPPARLADLRTALGWSYDKDEVAGFGDSVSDRWVVQGQSIQERDDRLFERRVWLHGLDSGRDALLHDYAYGGRGWEQSWLSGRAYPTSLQFFPGSAPLRALASGQGAASAAQARAQPAAQAIDRASRAYADNPWLPLWPLSLSEARPLRDGEAWRVHTDAGRLPLELPDFAGWSLLAYGGGQALNLMGEWDGRALRPLSAWREGAGERIWTVESA
ncbi:SWIM zinc finger family protein [Lysobacter sp. CA199]|uniref:SWIM zinc finger family protein n=1 Tax=Lysobacter sp. CA199 TaxID=3455608 RepID=UPI003F8D4D60